MSHFIIRLFVNAVALGVAAVIVPGIHFADGETAAADSDVAEPQDHQALLERVQTQLGERVAEVRATDRLTESAACLALGEYDMGEQMRKIMAATGQSLPESKPVLEINPEHALVARLAAADEQHFGDLAEVLFDQAQLADGRQLDDPAAFVQRLNRLLLELGA